MKFIQLTHDSSVADALTYLVQLALSPFAYHIDDRLDDDFSWGHGAPDPETLKVMRDNINVIYAMRQLPYDKVWEVYGAAWDIRDKNNH